MAGPKAGVDPGQVDKILKALVKIGTEKPKKMLKGMLRAGNYLKRMSQEIVPVDSSDLKSSCKVTEDNDYTPPHVLVTYSTDYAVYVHEDLDAQHAEGTQAKFLEDAFFEGEQDMIDIINKAVDED